MKSRSGEQRSSPAKLLLCWPDVTGQMTKVPVEMEFRPRPRHLCDYAEPSLKMASGRDASSNSSNNQFMMPLHRPC